MKDLSIIVYTNQTYLPIAKLSVENINKHFCDVDIQKYITSNSFNGDFKFNEMGITPIDSSIPFSENGSHFSRVLINALNEISSKYVLLILEDYIIMNDVKQNTLKNLISVMENENIDYLSLMSYEYNDWESLNIDYEKYSLPNNILMKFNYSYFYMFSVQPCIWKRESLITILEHNKNMSVHDFDTTNIKNKKGESRYSHNDGMWDTPDNFWDYNFNFVTLRKNELTKNYAFDERGSDGDYFLFLYSEIIRFGKFNFNTHQNNKIFLDKFLEEKNINKNTQNYTIFF